MMILYLSSSGMDSLFQMRMSGWVRELTGSCLNILRHKICFSLFLHAGIEQCLGTSIWPLQEPLRVMAATCSKGHESRLQLGFFSFTVWGTLLEVCGPGKVISPHLRGKKIMTMCCSFSPHYSMIYTYFWVEASPWFHEGPAWSVPDPNTWVWSPRSTCQVKGVFSLLLGLWGLAHFCYNFIDAVHLFPFLTFAVGSFLNSFSGRYP